ncbi:MAG: NAD+ synthase [Chloroflexi bacterium HGW-Chloroflexi-1]|nr:MAG: NAD+ synthase [Chloroflexi bacterium HGW-Chloroflexi-1]
MKITLAQLNPTIGDFAGNLAKIEHTVAACAGDAPDLVVFPELFLTGYPPRDLLERVWFTRQAGEAVAQLSTISRRYPRIGILTGVPLPTGRPVGKGLYNSALLICNGQVLFQQNKSLLPTYDVFDEARYFDPAPAIAVFPFRGETLGISICEDAWNDPEMSLPHYDSDPITGLAAGGATVMINIAASPFWAGKEEIRYRLMRRHALKHKTPFLSVNQVGANDELIFDGRSLFIDRAGRPAAVFPAFAEYVATVDTEMLREGDGYVSQPVFESIYQALLLGIRDYARKTGFRQVVLGLSGGIDSALTCALAVAALGPENVLGVTMPSHFSSEGSVNDARVLAENLGIRFQVISIADVHAAYLEMLTPAFAGRQPDVTEENIQARIRGNILMALSNKFGYLVLTTGNKSELAVGYCTLYGDMSGGLAVIADLPKTMVYELAHYVNSRGDPSRSPIIPQASIDKAPSAELRPNQTDQDTLPPYDTLDAVLHLYVDEGRSLAEIVAQGFDRQTAAWVLRAVDRSEYKRWQAASGLKVTSKAFGMGRRMPVAAKYSA